MIEFDPIFLVFPFAAVLVIFLIVIIVRNTQRVWRHILLDLFLIPYIFFVISLLYFPLIVVLNREAAIAPRMNLIPFISIFNDLAIAQSNRDILRVLFMVTGNLLIFAPLPVYMILRFPNDRRRSFWTVLIISVSAEILQLVLVFVSYDNSRIFDIDDLILNVIGGLSSWFLIYGRKQKAKTQ